MLGYSRIGACVLEGLSILLWRGLVFKVVLVFVWKYTAWSKSTKCVHFRVYLEATGDVGLGTGMGLQSTVNDAEAHHFSLSTKHCLV